MLSGALHQPIPQSVTNENPGQQKKKSVYRLRNLFYQLRNLIKTVSDKFHNEKNKESNSARWEFLYCLQSADPPSNIIFSPNFSEQLFAISNGAISTYIDQFLFNLIEPLCQLLEVDKLDTQGPNQFKPSYLHSGTRPVVSPELMHSVSPDTRATAIYAIELAGTMLSGRRGGFLTKQLQAKGFSIFGENFQNAESPFGPPNASDKTLGVSFPFTLKASAFPLPKELHLLERMPTILSPSALGRLKKLVKYPHFYGAWMAYFNCLIISSYAEESPNIPSIANEEDLNLSTSTPLTGLFQKIESSRLAFLSEEKLADLISDIGAGLAKAYHQIMKIALKQKCQWVKNGSSHANYLDDIPRTNTQLEQYKGKHGPGFLNFKKSGGSISTVSSEGKK
jgi:hypothetical protein